MDAPPLEARRLTRRDALLVGAGAAATWLAARPGVAAATRALAPAARVRFLSEPALAPPLLQVMTAPHGTAAGHIFVAPESGSTQLGPLIVDDNGELIWFQPVEGASVSNFSAQTYRGRPVLAWWEGTRAGGHGAGEYVLVGSDYREITRVRAGNGLSADFHEFTITPQGTALLTAYEAIPYDLSPLGGPSSGGTLLDSVIQEVDIASGAVKLEWRASDHVALEDSYAGLSGATIDLAHLNSASLDLDGNVLISARHTWTIYKIDRSTGAVIWRLGGKRSDFELDTGAEFFWQHHARRLPDGTLTLFDDGDGPIPEEPASRGLRLLVDENARTAAVSQEFIHPDKLLASAMGSMESVGDGGAFVGWGSIPAFSEFDEGGSLRFHAVFAGGGVSYRALRSTWKGAPPQPPSFAVGTVDGKRMGFASWNGATGVTHWRLRAGETKSRVLAARSGLAPKLSFETRLPIPPDTRFAAVDALDANGRTLATSAILRLR